jgi:hypothetical protein
MKKRTPRDTAIVEINLINLLISRERGVSCVSAVEARLAIYPMTVLSPVLKTIPTPEPLVQEVPKNATLGLSKMFLAFSSGSLKSSSDSPVKEALLTFISLVFMRTTSAGILSPVLISTISPGTNSTALISFL